MRILYYSSHPHLRLDAPTGYGRHMREMIRAWKNAGHEVLPVIAGGGNLDETHQKVRTVQSTAKAGIKKFIPQIIWETMRDWSLLRFDRKMAAELKRQVANFHPDLIYERATYLQTSGAQIAADSGVKYMVEVNAPYPEERVSFSGKSWLLGKANDAEAFVLNQADSISVVSSALKTHFAKRYSKTEDKIVVVPNAVNPKGRMGVKIEEPKSEYISEGALTIGFVGSIFPYHGVDVLIEAFAKLLKDGKSIRLLIVGDGMILPEMKALTRQLQVQDSVSFTGSLPSAEVPNMIRQMDICCMARSNWYGSPVKIFEYGLEGKAVLAPDEIPVHDVMTDEDAEIVQSDIESVYLGLRRLVEDESRRLAIAKNWQIKVQENYTWTQAAKKTLDACTSH